VRRDEKKVFRAGFVGGLGHYFVSLFWLLSIPFPWHAIAAFLALSSVLAGFMATWCWLCWRLLLPIGHFPRSKGKGNSPWETLLETKAAPRLFGVFLCAAAWVAV